MKLNTTKIFYFMRICKKHKIIFPASPLFIKHCLTKISNSKLAFGLNQCYFCSKNEMKLKISLIVIVLDLNDNLKNIELNCRF